MRILLKCACGQKEVVQLGDVSRVFERHADGQKVSCKFKVFSRGFERHADGQKVIVVNLRYFGA